MRVAHKWNDLFGSSRWLVGCCALLFGRLLLPGSLLRRLHCEEHLVDVLTLCELSLLGSGSVLNFQLLPSDLGRRLSHLLGILGCARSRLFHFLSSCFIYKLATLVFLVNAVLWLAKGQIEKSGTLVSLSLFLVCLLFGIETVLIIHCQFVVSHVRTGLSRLFLEFLFELFFWLQLFSDFLLIIFNVP